MAREAIKYENSKTHTEFRQLGVKNRTRLAMEAEQVITKQSLIEKAQYLCV